MSDYDFMNTDLSKVDTFKPGQGTGGYLSARPEPYHVRITGAEVKPSKKNPKNKVLHMEFDEVNGAGSIRAYLNIFHSSEKVMTIGMRELKTMLTHAGHPNPDRPGDHGGVTGYYGLELKIKVGTETGKDGKTRSKVNAFLPLEPGEAKSPSEGNGTVSHRVEDTESDSSEPVQHDNSIADENDDLPF